ncbi:sensitivity to red-light reduced protein [Sorochytrium milnesiophthora]
MLKVAVVDDCPINRLLIKKLVGSLLKHSITIDEYDNGQKCVQATCSTDYAFILMDIDMPVMNGLAATMHIRFPEKHSFPVRAHNTNIPIVAVTSNALPLQMEMCSRIGMDCVVQKPATRASLVSALDAVGLSCLLRSCANGGEPSVQCGLPDRDGGPCDYCIRANVLARTYKVPDPRSIGLKSYSDFQHLDVNHLIKLCSLNDNAGSSSDKSKKTLPEWIPELSITPTSAAVLSSLAAAAPAASSSPTLTVTPVVSAAAGADDAIRIPQQATDPEAGDSDLPSAPQTFPPVPATGSAAGVTTTSDILAANGVFSSELRFAVGDNVSSRPLDLANRQSVLIPKSRAQQISASSARLGVVTPISEGGSSPRLPPTSESSPPPPALPPPSSSADMGALSPPGTPALSYDAAASPVKDNSTALAQFAAARKRKASIAVEEDCCDDATAPSLVTRKRHIRS